MPHAPWREAAALGPADLPSLLDDVREPPVDMIGALEVDELMPARARKDLASALNNLLAAPGLWCLGRLQTDADRERVIEGIAREAGSGASAEELAALLKKLAPRWFLVRDVHARERDGMALMLPRWASR